MVLLRKKLENINLKYEKILRIINTIFNILWVLVYSIYFIISFYLLIGKCYNTKQEHHESGGNTVFEPAGRRNTEG